MEHSQFYKNADFIPPPPPRWFVCVCSIDFTVGWTWDQDCDNTVGYLGCFLESNRAIQADYDSDISSGATVEVRAVGFVWSSKIELDVYCLEMGSFVQLKKQMFPRRNETMTSIE